MPGSSDGSSTLAEPDFLELSLLLPRWQLLALDELAQGRGMNVGQMLRRLIGKMLQEIGESRQ